MNKALANTDLYTPKVYVVGEYDGPIMKMFENYGYRRAYIIDNADIVVFGGGPDVSPSWYGQTRRHGTIVDIARDTEDNAALIRTTKKQQLVGICRGAQFLNVRVGLGALYQHVDNHTTKHDAFEVGVEEPRKFQVSSTHHQMMIPGDGGQVLLGAREASKLYTTKVNTPFIQYDAVARVKHDNIDPEAIMYDHGGRYVFCFQPHPEYGGYDQCTDYFMTTISEYMLSKKQDDALMRNIIKHKGAA